MLIKIYQLIVLLKTIRKTLELIFKKKIIAITKILYILSNIYFNKKKNTSTNYVVHFLIKKIYAI